MIHNKNNNLLFWNACSIKKKIDDLNIFLNHLNSDSLPFLIFISEAGIVDFNSTSSSSISSSSSSSSSSASSFFSDSPSYFSLHNYTSIFHPHPSFKTHGIVIYTLNNVDTTNFHSYTHKPTLSYMSSKTSTQIEAYEFSFSPKALPILFLFSYISPTTRAEELVKIKSCISQALSFYSHVLALGDLNGRHEDWEDKESNTIGRWIKEVCLSQSLSILNEIFATGCTRPQSDSTLDMALANDSSIYANLETVSDADISSLSDHYPLLLSFSLSSLCASPFLRSPCVDKSFFVHWNLARANWRLYQELVDCQLDGWFAKHQETLNSSSESSAVVLLGSLDASLQDLYELILNAATGSIPHSQPCSRRKKPAWFFVSGVKEWYRRLNRARKSFLSWRKEKGDSQRTRELKRKFEECRKEWYRVVREAKKKSYEGMLCKLVNDDKISLSKLYRFLRNTTDSNLMQMLKNVKSPVDGSMPQTGDDAVENVATLFSHSFSVDDPVLSPVGLLDMSASSFSCSSSSSSSSFSVSSSSSSSTSSSSSSSSFASASSRSASTSTESFRVRVRQMVVEEFNEQKGNVGALGAEFLKDEVEQVCLSGKSKATDGDGLNPSFLAHGTDDLFRALLLIFNFSFRTAIVPTSWRSADVFPLPKKDSKPVSPSFRPISITSIVSRSFEHLIHNRVMSMLEEKGFFSPQQFGFRTKRNTYDSIFVLTHEIERALALSSFLPVLFVDVAKAFDSVWIDGLCFKLCKAGVDGRVFRWICSFLRNRKFRVRSHELMSTWKTIYCGVPQGSVLSPMLFLIYINDLSQSVGASVSSSMFADDLALYPKRYGIDGYKDLQLAAAKLVRYMSLWNLLFSFLKTNLVLFRHHQLSLPLLQPLYVEVKEVRHEIVIARSYNYLGLILHQYLSWKEMGKKVVMKSTQTAHAISKVCSGGVVSAVQLRNLILTLIYSQILYAMIFYTPSKQVVSALHSIILLPVRRFLALSPSVSKDALMVEFGLPSILDYRECLQLKYMNRVMLCKHDNPARVIMIQSWIKPLLPCKLVYRSYSSDEERKKLDRIKSFSHFPLIDSAVSYTTQSGREMLEVLKSLPFVKLSATSSHFSQLIAKAEWGAQSSNKRVITAEKNAKVDEINNNACFSSLLFSIYKFCVGQKLFRNIFVIETPRQWALRISHSRFLCSSPPSSMQPFFATYSPVLHIYLRYDKYESIQVRAQLRLNRFMSRDKLYQYGLVEDKVCLSCKREDETASHIFASCIMYEEERDLLRKNLNNVSSFYARMTKDKLFSVPFLADPVPNNLYSDIKNSLSKKHSKVLQYTSDFMLMVMQKRKIAIDSANNDDADSCMIDSSDDER